MAEVQRYNSKLESGIAQETGYHNVVKVDVHYELLTLREATGRFNLTKHRVYGWVRDGKLHPVRPNGRTLYPEWELRELAVMHIYTHEAAAA